LQETNELYLKKPKKNNNNKEIKSGGDIMCTRRVGISCAAN